MRYFLIIFFVLLGVVGHAQNGKIRGTVFDDSTGETLIGATVLIKGTTIGTITDLDGNFTLDVAKGIYDLQVTFISYEALTIEEVQVKANDVTILDNLRLKEVNLQIGEIVIKAEAVRTNETSLQTIKRKSAVILDGISSAKIQLIGDATAVEAAKRVTGVSIEGGKYIYVRGLGDRYSKTTLNGMDIPGLDPDRNSLQMDIFPTNLIDNLLVSKNFTADMPADFTGGIMNIETKDFPDKKIINVSVSASYNPDMHFNPNYLTHKGGKTDFLGFDDGTRAFPSGANLSTIPTPISGATQQEVFNFVSGFSPELGGIRQNSLLDYSAGFSFGNQINLDKKNKNATSPKLGYIFSLSYKSDYKYYDDVVYSEYQRYIDADTYEMRYATIQNGELGERNVLIGLMGGLAFKTIYSKIRLMAMHLQNGESRTGIFDIENDGQAVGQSGYDATSYNLEYNQRALTNILLNGTHVLKNSGWEIDWRLSPTFSSSDDPDVRKTAFTHGSNNISNFSAGAGGNPARIWRSLSELNVSAKFDLTRRYKWFNNAAKLRFGISQTYKKRDYEILFFDIQFFGSQPVWPNPDPSLVLEPENIYPNNSIYYQSGNPNPNPNAYESNVSSSGIYVSNEFSPFTNLKTILGLRLENYVQRHTGRAQGNNESLDNDKVLESIDFFPSVNFIFSLTEQQNIRGTYSRTIARPSFKELSFAQILDPISNRIFNGSLFTYSDWDGNLTETRIDNLDIRWELFLERGQMFSLSAFYKKFDDPIELVRIPEQQTSTEYQPRNVGDGLLYGLELEFRRDLDFISTALSNFNISGNFTYVVSQIDMTITEFNSRKSYEKTGETIKDTRQMAGQAPYVINSGISYSNADIGLEAGVFYNVKGPSLFIVGAGLFPDVYNEPFHSLNFSINKRIGKEQNTVLDFKVSNILNDKEQIFYKSYQAEKQLFESMSPGMSFSLGISYTF